MSERAPRLTVYMGLPGAGKSTHARAHAQGRIFTADPIRYGAEASLVIETGFACIDRALHVGTDVVYDGCSIDAGIRRVLLMLARHREATTRLVVVIVTPKQAMAAQRARAHPVPPGRMRELCKRWPAAYAAALHEPWDEIVTVDRRRMATGVAPVNVRANEP